MIMPTDQTNTASAPGTSADSVSSATSSVRSKVVFSSIDLTRSDFDITRFENFSIICATLKKQDDIQKSQLILNFPAVINRIRAMGSLPSRDALEDVQTLIDDLAKKYTRGTNSSEYKAIIKAFNDLYRAVATPGPLPGAFGPSVTNSL